jgi:hypothetical protein
MSLPKLQIFLKDHNHDIIDFWICENRVVYVRSINRNTGILVFIKTWKFDITFEQDVSSTYKVFHLSKVLENEEDYSEKLILLYDSFIKIFPENRKHFILQCSNFLIENRHCIYRLNSFSNDTYNTIHWGIDLDWFYDNLNMVDHEVNRLHFSTISKMEKMYESFIDNYSNFIKKSEQDIKVIHRVWSFYKEQNGQFCRGRSLYLNIAKKENDIKQTYLELDSLNGGSFNFNESLRKSHQKKALRAKLNNLMQLRYKTTKEIALHWNLSYHILISFLYFISEITITLSKFHGLFIELDNIVPPRTILNK